MRVVGEIGIVEGEPSNESLDELRAGLLAKLSAEFELEQRPYALGGRDLTMYAITNPDRLLDDDRLLETPHEELPWHPYWVHAGAAAIGLASWLCEQSLAGQTVLDLGSGLGLTALAAAHAGASVVACDHAPPAVDFTRLNTLAFLDRVKVRRFDWRYDEFQQQFDLIVCSDVLYNRADTPFLERIWRNATTSDGRIVLGDPNRPLTADLLRSLASNGWRVDCRLVTTSEGTARISELTDMQTADGKL